jgi:hypothetical protein
MDTANISFDIDTTDSNIKLGVEVWIDNACMYQTEHVTEQYHFSHDISDDDSKHELKIILKGKTNNHTEIDEQGNIIKDAMISISNIQIDEIDVTQVFHTQTQYHHNFNGTQPDIEDTFHGLMGCNGTLSLKFTTPIYLWLLENM